MAKKMEMVLVASSVKALIKAGKCNTSGDALDGLNGVVHWYVQQAVKRPPPTARKTVRSHDFCTG